MSERGKRGRGKRGRKKRGFWEKGPPDRTAFNRVLRKRRAGLDKDIGGGGRRGEIPR